MATFQRSRGHQQGPVASSSRLDPKLELAHEQISDLTLNLHACQARVSALQARLSAAHDALDAAQRLRTEDDHAARLAEQNAFAAELSRRQAEADRDELRDAVQLLVERVEAQGDWRSLNHASIALLEPLQPMTKQHSRFQPLVDIENEEDDDRANITALLGALTTQLEDERARRRAAEAHVATLEAQLARRDVELEAHLHCPPLPGSIPHVSSVHDSHASALSDDKVTMSREAALDVIGNTLARNRALEQEIRILDQRLKDAQLEDQEDAAPPRVKSAPPLRRDVGAVAGPSSPRKAAHPSRRRPQQQQHQISPFNSPRASPILPPLQPGHRTREDMPRAIQILDRQVQGLQSLDLERARMVDAFSVGPQPPSDTEFAQISLIEAECIRLTKRVRELEDGLARCTCGAPTGLSLAAGEPAGAFNPFSTRPPVQPSFGPFASETPALASSSRLSQLAADLQAARDEVDSKERAMEDLRGEIEELRERVQGGREIEGME